MSGVFHGSVVFRNLMQMALYRSRIGTALPIYFLRIDRCLILTEPLLYVRIYPSCICHSQALPATDQDASLVRATVLRERFYKQARKETVLPFVIRSDVPDVP